jgi:hypothetical protein
VVPSPRGTSVGLPTRAMPPSPPKSRRSLLPGFEPTVHQTIGFGDFAEQSRTQERQRLWSRVPEGRVSVSRHEQSHPLRQNRGDHFCRIRTTVHQTIGFGSQERARSTVHPEPTRPSYLHLSPNRICIPE